MESVKRNLRIILFVLLLAAVTVIFISRRDSTLKRSYSNYFPVNAATIDKVLILQGNDTIVLEQDSNKWVLNGITVARNDRLMFLMESLERIELVTPATKSAEKDIIENLLTKGKHVQLYSRGKLNKDFRIYYSATGIAGTYILPGQSETPFMVRLRGYSVDNIEEIFSADHRNWSENILFDLSPDEIREVIVEYPSEPEHSYKIFRSGNADLVLSDLKAAIPAELTNIQELSDYLYFFSNIRFQHMNDSIRSYYLSESPFAILRIVTQKNQLIHLEAYRLLHEPVGLNEYDINRFSGLINQGHDTVILDFAELDPIFRQMEDFKKK